MCHAYENAGKVKQEVKKLIENVVENCGIYKKNARSKPKPIIAVP